MASMVMTVCVVGGKVIVGEAGGGKGEEEVSGGGEEEEVGSGTGGFQESEEGQGWKIFTIPGVMFGIIVGLSGLMICFAKVKGYPIMCTISCCGLTLWQRQF